MYGDQVTVGDVIDFKATPGHPGVPAVVVETWTTQDDAPIRKAPVGCVVVWTDEHGNEQRTRIVWPNLTLSERRTFTPDEVAERLPIDLAALPVDLAPAEG